MLNIKDLKANIEKIKESVEPFKLKTEQMIKDSDKVFIIPHKGADIDAIASSIGVSMICDKLKRENHIVVGDKFEELYHGVQEIIEEVKDEHSIIGLEDFEKMRTKDSLNILCDVSNPQIIYPKELDAKKLAIIDHHCKKDEWFEGAVSHVDKNSSSASEIVSILLSLHNININPKIANILYAGIRLDTNKLSNDKLSPTTMLISSELCNLGASNSAADLYTLDDFNQRRRVEELTKDTIFLTTVIAVTPGKEKNIYTKEELAQAADSILKSKKTIDKKIDAAFSVGKLDDGTVQISARGSDTFYIKDIVEQLGGGSDEIRGASNIANTSVEETVGKIKQIVLPFQARKTVLDK